MVYCICEGPILLGTTDHTATSICNSPDTQTSRHNAQGQPAVLHAQVAPRALLLLHPTSQTPDTQWVTAAVLYNQRCSSILNSTGEALAQPTAVHAVTLDEVTSLVGMYQPGSRTAKFVPRVLACSQRTQEPS